MKIYVFSHLKQVVTLVVNQIYFFCFTCFSLIYFWDMHINNNINNHFEITECPTDMKQTALKKEFHKLSIYAKKN